MKAASFCWGCAAWTITLSTLAFFFFQLYFKYQFHFIAFISRCVENIEEHWDNVRKSVPRTLSKFSNTLVKSCKYSLSWGENIKKKKNTGKWGILRALTFLCSGQRTFTLLWSDPSRESRVSRSPVHCHSNSHTSKHALLRQENKVAACVSRFAHQQPRCRSQVLHLYGL